MLVGPPMLGGRPITTYAPPSGLRFPQHLALRDRIADRVDQGFEIVSETSVSAHLVRTPRFAPRAFLRAPGYLVESARGRHRTVHLSVRHDGTLDERETLVVIRVPSARRPGWRRALVGVAALAAGMLAIVIAGHPAI